MTQAVTVILNPDAQPEEIAKAIRLVLELTGRSAAVMQHIDDWSRPLDLHVIRPIVVTSLTEAWASEPRRNPPKRTAEFTSGHTVQTWTYRVPDPRRKQPPT